MSCNQETSWTNWKDRGILTRQERLARDLCRNSDSLIRRALQERNASAIVEEEENYVGCKTAAKP